MFAIRLLVTFLAVALIPAAASAEIEGVSPSGKKGRLHVVKEGDTLWDLSSTYLGTPWAWPAVWRENDIDNPHLIYPGDLIWITEAGMRKITAEEAERLLKIQEREQAAAAPEPEIPEPAAPEPEQPEARGDPFAALDASGSAYRRSFEYPGMHRFSFISPTELGGSASILGSHEEAYWTSQERKTIVSLGEGQVHIGDRYSLFRTRRRVLHPETGRVAGYFVQILGIAEVVEIHPETSFVKVLSAYAEIEPGDRLMPYVEEPSSFTSSGVALDVKGVIIAQQPYRQHSGQGDLVILDRGTDDGVSTGVELEVFRAGKEVTDPVTMTQMLVPDDVIGRMFVLKVAESTSVALLSSAGRPVRVGDRFRGR